MKRLTCAMCLCGALGAAEVRMMTLKEAAEVALKASPEALLSRLEEQKAAQRVQVARDPFVPKVYAGSGLAYSSGFPMSIDGAAPSVVQARAVASVYNKREKFQVAQAREEARGVALDGQTRRENAVYRTLDLFLEAEQKGRVLDMARKQVESVHKVEEVVKLRVKEGRELPLEASRAALAVARAEQRVMQLEADRDHMEAMLGQVLGMAAGDRVRAAGEEREAAVLPATEPEAVEQATLESREVRRLESALLGKAMEAQAQRAARWPTLDLVAQYGLFAKFNRYEDFFRHFQRHNGQLGVSVQIPLVSGSAAKALAEAAETEVARLRVEMSSTRSRIAVEASKKFQDVKRTEGDRKVSRLELDVAREELSVELAKMDEGRSTLRQVEGARMAEQERWMKYYEAQYAVERARYALLERTGGLVAALR